MPNAISHIAHILSSVEGERRAKYLELLQNPDVAELVSLVAQQASSQNGYRNGGRVDVVGKTIIITSNAKPGVRTGLKEAIRKLDLPHRFTSNDVLQSLNSSGFQFPDLEDVKGSVRDALLSLRSGINPELKLVQKGKSNEPNVYEWMKR